MRDRNWDDLNITDASKGAAITVQIVPLANKTEIVGIQEDGTVKIRLMAPPVEGEVNQELIEFLAGFLGCSTDDIEIVAGLANRKLLVSVVNVHTEDVERLFREASPKGFVDNEG